MVTDVYFYADENDTAELMKYLRFGLEVSLYPWPLVPDPTVYYQIDEAVAAGEVMVQSRQLGPAVLLRDSDPAYGSVDRAGLFNRMNRESLKPGPDSGYLVDSNRSPVLLWQPGPRGTAELRTDSIGSQGDSMKTVSAEYERWVIRVKGWIRRHGTKVWGLERSATRPDLDIDLSLLNSVYALPTALRLLEAGAAGR